MNAKTLVNECIERERAYLSNQEVGSKEYNESLSRLNTLQDKLIDQEDRFVKNILEAGKFAIGSVVVPVVMTLVVLKFEETGSITTAMRKWATEIIPKKNF
ncbi:MAG: hypothetical protein ACI4DK_13425 [Lachnospiraceae bacterium]